MVSVSWAISGRAIATLAVEQVEGASVKSLKTVLAKQTLGGNRSLPF